MSVFMKEIHYVAQFTRFFARGRDFRFRFVGRRGTLGCRWGKNESSRCRLAGECDLYNKENLPATPFRTDAARRDDEQIDTVKI